MRRWNGWGDETVTYAVTPAVKAFLENLIGPGRPVQDLTLAEVTNLARQQPSRLPDHPLLTTEAVNRVKYASGQSLPDLIATRSGLNLAFPDGVAYPTTPAEVRDLLRYAQERNVRLIPYGGGTSVAGHINPLPGDAPILTVSLERLNRLQTLDEKSALATFGAGGRGPELEAQLRARGYTLGHFPQSFELSTLGGWVATRSSGQQSLYYGRIERLFAGGTLETPVGTLEIPSFPASAAATDLREIALGSEGRMGIITEASVRVTPLPEREVFAGVFFPHFEIASAAARAIAQARIALSMLRVSTGVETATTLGLSGHAGQVAFLERGLAFRGITDEKSLMLLGATGSKRQVRATLGQALEIIRGHKGVYLGPLSQALGRQWQKSRFRMPYLRNSLWEIGFAVDTVETATNWTHLPTLLENLEKALRNGLQDIGERVHVFTHLSHLYPQGSSIYTTYAFRQGSDADETLRRWQILKKAASQVIVAQHGTISHQHGVGLDHAPYLEAEKGALGLATMRSLYQHFDPAGIMNPGKTC